MLDALRRGAVNWLAKILLGLLVIAFAIWGVADVFRGYGTGTVARVGSIEISTDEYRQAYQNELDSISRRFGRRLTAEQAKLLGIEQRALSRLMGAAAIDNHTRELHLSLSEQGIADIIRDDPAFHGPNGQFSRTAFQAYLRQNGYSEGRYLYDRRKEEVRDQLTDTLLGGLAPPQLVLDLLHRYREETRVIAHFTPDYDKLVKVAEPDETKLREHFEQNKRQYVTPELRKINVLLLTRDAVKARTAVADDEVKAAYEAEKEKYNIPEKRRVQQLAFPDKAAAEKAYAELAKAKNFKDAVAKLGFKESDIDLGLIARKDMIDAKTAEAAFALKKDELSKPVEGQFALVLLRVGEIVPGKQKTFEEVGSEIKDRLAEERAAQEIQTLHEKVENERSAGKPLKEVGEQFKLLFREVAEIDRTGKGPDGKAVNDLPQAAKVAQAAFAGAQGLEAEATELDDGGYAWIDVLGVTPEKQKPFEDVTAEVKTAFIEAERRKEVAALAAKYTERLTAGEALEALAKEAGSKVEKTNPVTRSTSPQGLTQNAVQQAFTLPKGAATSAVTADNKGRTILRVVDIIPAPAPTAEQTERLKTELTRQMQTDILAEYVGGLQARYGVSINEAALKQTLGTQREAPDSE
ncbi:MAG TPA: SurA N-terminal domain-containing protein [Hyphomicrobiaceae bacterium]|nr:SurA N-terminal domain-containing protein [Hyphomicrobiaceae bacterium]